MIVDFICKGNVYRSRIAHAVALCQSTAKSVTFLSSGVEADNFTKEDRWTVEYVDSFLLSHKVKPLENKEPVQLSQRMLVESNLIVFMHRNVYDMCTQFFDTPKEIIVWDIPDYDKSSGNFEQFTEEMFKNISLNVKGLLDSLGNK